MIKTERKWAYPTAFLLLMVGTVLGRVWQLGTLPTGLWFDEAWVSVRALQADTPIYFAADFGGMHPAVVYLTRLAQPFFDHHPLTIRYAVAIVCTVTVLAATAVFARIRSAEKTAAARWYGLSAAALLSLCYPFFHFSRLGFESILPAPAALVAFGALLRWWDGDRRPIPLVWLGVVCGGCWYVFDTGRFIPVAVAAAFWWLWWTASPRPSLRTAIGWFAVIVGTAVVVAAPLLWYFGQNWAQLTARAAVTTYNTLGPGAESIPAALAANIGRTAAGLVWPGWGDELVRHNLPGRPVFDPVTAGLFLVGLVRLVRRPRTRQAAVLLSWTAVMLLPVVLTDGAPTYTRILGAVPALAGIAAVGAFTLAQFAADRLRRPGVGGPVVGAGVLMGALFTAGDYFGRWAAHPDLFDAFQAGQWLAGQDALAATADGPVYFVPDRINLSRPTLALLLNDSPVRAHPAAPCIVYPTTAEQAPRYVINLRADKQMEDRLAALFPQAERENTIRHRPSGDAIYRRLTVPAGRNFAADLQPSGAEFAETIRLRGYASTPTENELHLTAVWEAATRPTEAYTLFIHLYPAGERNAAPMAQIDTAPCVPTDRLRSGEQVLDEYSLPIPADLPPGRYEIAVGWYAYPSLARLPVRGGDTADGRLWLDGVAVVVE